MVKFLAPLACTLQAFDCAEKAMGTQKQVLFSDAGNWVWWVASVGWAVCAIGVFALLQERRM